MNKVIESTKKKIIRLNTNTSVTNNAGEVLDLSKALLNFERITVKGRSRIVQVIVSMEDDLTSRKGDTMKLSEAVGLLRTIKGVVNRNIEEA